MPATTHHRRLFAAAACAVALVVAGCGGAANLVTGRPAQARDAGAQSDAANAVTQMETCFVAQQTYIGCPSADAPVPATVTVSGQGQSGYVVDATSISGSHFIITRSSAGYARTCTGTTAGCTNGSW